MSSFDGAVFPHAVTAKFTVNCSEAVRKNRLGAGNTPPAVHEQVTVIYREDNPAKFSLDV